MGYNSILLYQFCSRADQYWLVLLRESPRLALKPRLDQNLFNLTISYHRNADILRPYGIVLSKENNKVLGERFNQTIIDEVSDGWHKDFDNNFTSSIIDPLMKTKKVLWVVSHCGLEPRTTYAAQLMRHVRIDVYGQCVQKQLCTANERRRVLQGNIKRGCEAKLYSKYKFYLAFENSQCEDYLTGKLFYLLRGHANSD